ncbi:MAG: glycosyltransferase [Anaerolineae bacterium]|jgi:UDP:flavonoid glycosyltransferase YjiC (YdhE family)|nr:glycosyltransferase [Anaerolineae bacterium]
MKTIAFFISPHGFGHASRATAVMQAILRQQESVDFLIFTTIPEWFFKDQGLISYQYILSSHDVGLVQLTPFEEDLPETLNRLDAIFPYSVNLISRTVEQLKKAAVDLVICDIAPLGLVAAKQCGIPSLLIENFTWDWIYKPYVDAYPQFGEFIDLFDSIFPLADYHIQAEPICQRLSNVPKVNEPISRSFSITPTAIREKLGIQNHQQLVLISFGGNREQFDNPQFLNEYEKTIFLIAGRGETLTRNNNVISVPHNGPYYHPDLIRAADIIIGKAGYSTLAEVVLAGKPFAFISRESNAESAVLARHILNTIPAIEITQQEYVSQMWIHKLPRILELPPTSPAPVNGADLVAEFIFSEILG